MNLEQVFLIVLGAWLFGLTTVIAWLFWHLKGLIKESGGKTLVKTLKNVFQREKKNETEISDIKKEIGKIRKDDLAHLQKVGLIRFNPFNETGGDHSFSIALLNGKNTGFVLTGLHTRERTRIYIKRIEKSKSKYELSKEELKAIDKAKKG